jgi:hypothetical protein
MEFKLINKQLSLGQVANEYADVHLHIENQKTFSTLKANKIILALHSPYFHRLFQSSEKSETFHVCFVGVANFAIRDAVRLMYGESITIPEKNAHRFSAFLKSIEIEFESPQGNQQGGSLRKKQKLSTEETSVEKHSNVSDLLTSIEENEEEEEPRMTRQSPSPLTTTQRQIEEPNSTSNEELRKHGSLSSPDSVKITNRKGEIASLDNWTKTSDDIDLDDIDFESGAGNSEGKHCDYVCNHCRFKVQSFSKARQHFVNFHQKGDKELEIIQEVMNFKKLAFSEINKLKANIGGGCNKTLATSQLETIIDNLEQRVYSLRNLNDKNLSPNLKAKQNVLLQGINDSIKKVKSFIEEL